MTNYFTYTNNNDGLEAIVATGNDRHDYRVIMNDTDAWENSSVLFTDSIQDKRTSRQRSSPTCESIA